MQVEQSEIRLLLGEECEDRVGSVVATTLVYPAALGMRLKVRTLLASLSTTRMRADENP